MSILNLNNRNQTGFTMIEVIAVLVVISIISVVLATRLMSTDAQLIAATDVIKTHLRYAQSRAMSDNKIWGISCDGTNYWLYNNGNIGSKVTLPGENSDTIDVTATDDYRWKGIGSIEAFTISFDDWGIPHTDPAATDGKELTSGHAYSQITVGASATITITPNTGFIP